MNRSIAKVLIDQLVGHGVTEFVVCAGARNAPLVVQLDEMKNQVRVHHFFDEKAASFFALGLAKRCGKATAVVTTSGTAAAELLPAAVESFYSQVPLVFITADRPRAFRGSGAPQAIHQVGLYSEYAKVNYDIETLKDLNGNSSGLEFSSEGLTHINICFSEPLLDSNDKTHRQQVAFKQNGVGPEAIQNFFSQSKRPLVLLGAFPKEYESGIVEYLNSFGAPVWIEAQSQLRELPSLQSLRVLSAEWSLSADIFEEYFDSILRIGSIPTLRIWRDLELSLEHIPVLNVSDNSFSGLARDKSNPISFAAFMVQAGSEKREHGRDFLSFDMKNFLKMEQCLEKFSYSEPSMVRTLSEKIPQNSVVFLGNSLPIREWDLAAAREYKNFDIQTNRGANGIDGLVSTFLGMVKPDVENWLILGDLSALYDLNALALISPELQSNIRIVVINNKGGQIFRRMFKAKSFLNEHDIRFKSWAEMFGLEYRQISGTDWPDLNESRKAVVLELLPRNNETDDFWQEMGQKVGVT